MMRNVVHGDDVAPSLLASSGVAETPDRRSTSRRATLLLGWTALLIPVGAYVWFVDHFAVNAIFGDQWSNVNLLHTWYAGHLDVGTLWAPHGDHRMFFPNLIVLGLAQFTHFNVVAEEYLSVLMLMATALLVVVGHRRRCPVNLVWYAPVVVLLFSFVQFQNTLWGFQMAWFLVTLCVVASLFILDRSNLSWPWLTAAVIVALVGSYSSLQGLVVWPAGLLLLYQRRHRPHQLWIWSGCALIVAAIYFRNLHAGAYSNNTYIFTHPVATVKFVFFLIGSVLGTELTNSPAIQILLGATMTAVAVGLLVRYSRRDDESSRPFSLAIIVYGLSFALTITEGRASFGLWAPARYVSCGILILTGCYLVLIDRSAVGTDASQRTVSKISADSGRALDWGRFGHVVAWAVVIVAILGEVIWGTGRGFTSAQHWSERQIQEADLTVNYEKATPALLGGEIVRGSPADSRIVARTLQQHRLSVFATGEAPYYERIGLLPVFTNLRTSIAAPAQGSMIDRTETIDVLISDLSGVNTVTIHAVGSKTRAVIRATPTFYGWIASWDTTKVPNGRYSLSAVVVADTGTARTSAAVEVTVQN